MNRVGDPHVEARACLPTVLWSMQRSPITMTGEGPPCEVAWDGWADWTDAVCRSRRRAAVVPDGWMPWGAALLVTGTPLALGVRLVCVVGSEPPPRPSSVAVPGAWAAVHEEHHACAEEASDQGACAASAEQGPQPEGDQR